MTGFADLNTVTVTGTFLMLDGSFATGRVKFTPTPSLQAIIDTTAEQIIVPEVITATLNGSGHISQVLPATNDPDVSPIGWLYNVVEIIDGRSTPGNRSYSIALPFDAAGGTVDLSRVSPMTELPNVSGYVLIGDFDALEARVAALEAGVVGGGTIDGGIIT